MYTTQHTQVLKGNYRFYYLCFGSFALDLFFIILKF